jgi:lysophospholipase-2
METPTLDDLVKHLVLSSNDQEIVDTSSTSSTNTMERPSDNIPAPYVVKPTGEHTHTIIFLPGRGGCGEHFAEEIFDGINTVDFPHCKWIFPGTGDIYDATFEQDMAQWFDLQTTSDPHREPQCQIDGLTQSAARINALIEEELRDIPANNIILEGMSQGYATAALCS